MNVQCAFKNTVDVESFCQLGAAQSVYNPYETDFVAVEVYLWNEYFKEGARQLVGFPTKIARTYDGEGRRNWHDAIRNSDHVLRQLSSMFPEMGCRCSYANKPAYHTSKKGVSFSMTELSCPHFGIRAIASEALKR